MADDDTQTSPDPDIAHLEPQLPSDDIPKPTIGDLKAHAKSRDDESEARSQSREGRNNHVEEGSPFSGVEGQKLARRLHEEREKNLEGLPPAVQESIKKAPLRPPGRDWDESGGERPEGADVLGDPNMPNVRQGKDIDPGMAKAGQWAEIDQGKWRAHHPLGSDLEFYHHGMHQGIKDEEGPNPPQSQWRNIKGEASPEMIEGSKKAKEEEKEPQTGGNDKKPDWYNPPEERKPETPSFVDPKSNPDVSQKVLNRYKGKRLPATIRTNNPAALSVMHPGSGKEFAERQPGYVGFEPRPKKEGGGYAKYATPEHGTHASSELLSRYGQKGVNTPDKIVRRWSTQKSAWKSYSRSLQKALGLKSGHQKIDLSDPEVRAKVLEAKSGHESGAGVPIYTAETFRRGVRGEYSPQTMEAGSSHEAGSVHEAGAIHYNQEASLSSDIQRLPSDLDKEVQQGKNQFDTAQKHEAAQVDRPASKAPVNETPSAKPQASYSSQDNNDIKLRLFAQKGFKANTFFGAGGRGTSPVPIIVPFLFSTQYFPLNIGEIFHDKIWLCLHLAGSQIPEILHWVSLGF